MLNEVCDLNILNYIRSKFCKHWEADLISWKWMYDFKNPYIDAEYKCKDCNKIMHIKLTGKEAEEWNYVMTSNLF